ncbi:Tc toxin subunit A, partial [Acidobacteriota bacterium]
MDQSGKEKIIAEHNPEQIETFLEQVHKIAAEKTLAHKAKNRDITVDNMLSFALPKKQQRTAFMDSLRNFHGDYEKFWKEHLPNDPAFKNKPELIPGILFTNQLILLTGNHPLLVEELQVKRHLGSPHQLLELSTDQWKEILEKTGVPEHIKGKDDEEKMRYYIEHMQNLLHAAYPTQKVALMVKNKELPITDANVAEGISTFLSNNEKFDFAGSRIFEFEEEIKTASPVHHEKVRNELLTIQRVFQVSPSPGAMSKLMENGLNSAYTIAAIPGKSFIKMYSEMLGGMEYAYAVHQKASYINTRAEHIAAAMYELSHSAKPGATMSLTGDLELMRILKSQVPNYTELFGSPDICACEHCRSVYSPAAYFVDLLRFLWRGEKNADKKSPLDLLEARRPDLLHLPLTCENTNTLIPYIDLVNEVMEYYTAFQKLDKDAAFDTGDTTAEELRANPQNVNLEAFRKLKDAVYPFTLPYHQPLDMIRTYGTHLKTSRYQVMKTMQTDFSQTAVRALEAEALHLSEEEYTILTKKKFDDSDETIALHQYFGYPLSSHLEQVAEVPEFLKRSGTAYKELVELVKTRFINPGQAVLDYLQDLFTGSGIEPSTIYDKLEQIESGALLPSADADIMAVLIEKNITSDEFVQWVQDHLDEFRSVITLYQPDSKCELDTTCLRTVKKVYEGIDNPGITDETWSEIHRFIRLWRKLGWNIHELDLVLYSLGEEDITPQTISKLLSVVLLNDQLKRPLDQLATIWGDIDTYGVKSLYKKLFLNKAVQRIDTAFAEDRLGRYLAGQNLPLMAHVPAILAAFRMTAEDLHCVLDSAVIIDNGVPRSIHLETDALNLANLSTIYRYVMLAKALKFRLPDFCLLIKLFNGKPFSHWDIQQEKYLDISPAETLKFSKLAADVKKAGFKPAVLQYIFTGNVPVESTLGLDSEKTIQAAKSIRTVFTFIDQDHPEAPPFPHTPEILSSKLLLFFPPEVVEQLMAILEGTSQFTTITEMNLAVEIPVELKEKYSYIKGSGRLTCTGVMTDSEKDTLKALDGVTISFEEALDELYKMPEDFIRGNFYGVFATDMDEAISELLRRSETPSTSKEELEEKLNEKVQYVYKHFIPLLRQKLHEDAVVLHIAALTGLSEAAAAILIKNDLNKLVAELSQPGFSATYFKDAVFGVVGKECIDREIDFTWGVAAPDTLVPADRFSVRWQALLAPPASADYTLLVEVRQADESFKLYIDDVLILQKTNVDTVLSREYVISLDVSRMYRFKLEYTEITEEAGIRLSWKTPTMAAQIIPSSSAFPAAVIDYFITGVALYHRAAKFISGFQLNERELEHFSNFSADFADIDFKALQPKHWVRIHDYVTLRSALPQAQAALVDVFAEANKSAPAPTLSTLEELLQKASAWDTAAINYLAATYFNLAPDDFKNEI